MNASADERLIVMLEARIRDFEKNMAKAEKRGTRTYQGLRKDSRSATHQMERDMNRASGRINQAVSGITGQIGTMGKAFAGGLIGAAGIAAVTGAVAKVNQLAESVAMVGDEARRAGLSAGEFQQWKYVAEQNRIGIDQMVDGIKELQLRADEFAVTGKGPAAEAFERLGYSADQVTRKLEHPSELMLEIIGRMEQMDRAAQIRIADELFGGSAGERFVELLDQGADKIRETKDEAVDLGLVMDDELIAKAAQLNREFNTVASTVGVALKSAIISAAASLSDFIDGFRAFEEQRSTTLQDRQTEIMRERAQLLERIDGYEAKNERRANRTGGSAGHVEQLRAEVAALTEEEDRIIAVLSERNKPNWTPKEDTWTPPERPSTPTSPSGSRGSSGGSGSSDDFQRAIEETAKRTQAYQMEAAAIEEVSNAGREHGDTLDFARKRAELLIAAQQSGVDLTPEMIAGIDDLARAYSEAGTSAEEAAGKMSEVEAASKRGRDAIGGIFGAALEGADAAKQAVVELMAEIAKIQFQKAILGGLSAGGGGPLVAGLGSLLSFDGGGYTGDRPRTGGLDGKGGFLAVMHPRETVTDHTQGATRAMTMNFAPVIHAPGADAAGLESVRQEVRRLSDELPARMSAFMREASISGGNESWL